MQVAGDHGRSMGLVVALIKNLKSAFVSGADFGLDCAVLLSIVPFFVSFECAVEPCFFF